MMARVSINRFTKKKKKKKCCTFVAGGPAWIFHNWLVELTDFHKYPTV